MVATALVSSNITAKTAACIGFWSPGERRKKQKSLILRAYQERISLRGLSRLFGIHRLTIARWIGEHVAALPTLVSTLLPAQPDDVLEFDEAWSFVRKRRNKRWLWTVMCRRTRQFDDFLYWRCNGIRFRQKIFKSWPLCSGTAANRVVAVYGTRCHVYIADVSPIATSGKRIKRCCPKKPIPQSAKAADSYPIWSVGIVHCDKGKPVMSAKRSHSQRAMRTIIWSPTGLSLTTTWR